MGESQPMTEAMYYVLLALMKPDHGYGIMQHIKQLSGSRVVMGPGTLYGVLTRMKKEGMIVLEKEDERRKTYLITDKGKAALLEEFKRLRQMVKDGEGLEELE
ncbi:MAG: PadR family transcriptional regulator [Oscillospiraceae bacterium]